MIGYSLLYSMRVQYTLPGKFFYLGNRFYYVTEFKGLYCRIRRHQVFPSPIQLLKKSLKSCHIRGSCLSIMTGSNLFFYPVPEMRSVGTLPIGVKHARGPCCLHPLPANADQCLLTSLWRENADDLPAARTNRTLDTRNCNPALQP